MFGPDICGPSNKKTHVIFHYPPKNDNLLIKNEVKVESDRGKHLYTLVVRPDNTFEVFIDLESVKAGKLAEEFDFLLPKTIKDPTKSKPADWVDAKKVCYITSVHTIYVCICIRMYKRYAYNLFIRHTLYLYSSVYTHAQ